MLLSQTDVHTNQTGLKRQMPGHKVEAHLLLVTRHMLPLLMASQTVIAQVIRTDMPTSAYTHLLIRFRV
jgi:hypothetical protein